MMNAEEMQTAVPRHRSRVVKVIKRVVIGALVVYGLLVIVRTGQLLHADDTAKKVAAIHEIRLTLADVDGSKLPPEPNKAENDATVAGIDVNHNYVRDDVERWIFDHYTDQKERAVWMQWARAEAMVMTHTESKETLKAALGEEMRATGCEKIYYDLPNSAQNLALVDSAEKGLIGELINTPQRNAAYVGALKNISSFGDIDGAQCDIFPEIR